MRNLGDLAICWSDKLIERSDKLIEGREIKSSKSINSICWSDKPIDRKDMQTPKSENPIFSTGDPMCSSENLICSTGGLIKKRKRLNKKY